MSKIEPRINITLYEDGAAKLYNPSDMTLELGVNLFYDEAALAQARREALEEAAKIVAGWRESDWPEGFCRRTTEIVCQDRAAAIRALIEKEE